jgi:hypothetical protein
MAGDSGNGSGSRGRTLNVAKRGGRLSFGGRWASVNVDRRGTQETLSLLGTDRSYVFRKRR